MLRCTEYENSARGKRVQSASHPSVSTATQGTAGAYRRRSSRDVAGVRVMLIDDEVDLLEVLAEELSDFGFEVTAVDNGRDAIRVAQHERFDVAITDFKMPDMDGLQTAVALKKLDPQLPIIMATGYASKAAMLALGPRQILVGLLLKPFALDQVLEIVQHVLFERSTPEGGHHE
jgi:CheY-like chemotaxis protein